MGFLYLQHIKVETECVEEAEIYEGDLSWDNFVVNWSQSFNILNNIILNILNNSLVAQMEKNIRAI